MADETNRSNGSTSSILQDRTTLILKAVNARDVASLKTLAQGGFVNAELRRQVWPLLLRVDIKGKGREMDKAVAAHADESQVLLDVNRSFIAFPDVSPQDKDKLRIELELVIVTVLRQHPALRYFQGFHDIASIFLLMFDDTAVTMAAVEAMSLHRIRDSMGKGLDPVLGYLKLLNRILVKADSDLADVVKNAAALPYFSLSWVLTLMSHDLSSLSTIARLFDFLLAHNPAMICYLGVAIILLKKQELSELDEEDINDPAVLHHTLSRLPNLQDRTTDPPSSTVDEDEDLLSNATLTESESSETDDDTSSRSRSRSDSVLSDSIDALEDSMLYDPDIFGPAFLSPQRIRRRSLVQRRRRSDSMTPPTSPSPPVLPLSPDPSSSLSLPVVEIEDVIAKALELYLAFPLLGENGIGADEIMGPKSCVFTWGLSDEGRLSNDEADTIAERGVDIVVDEEIERAKEEDLRLVKEQKRKSREAVERHRRRRRNVVGTTVIAMVGVVGVLIAVYGLELTGSSTSTSKEWRMRPLGNWFG